MRALVVLVSAVLALSGCAVTATLPEMDEKAAAYLADKPKDLHSVFSRVPAEGERNHVLNRLRAGLATMESGHRDLAARTFDEALLTIETIYGGDEKAAKARGLFNAEDRKVFRGEPYERTMAYYYRGILYLMEGDYENARASFKSGSLQDSLAEKEEFRQDFALLEFLEGWASQCNGDVDLSREAYEIARSHNGDLTIPGPQDDLLVLAELGYAPVKYAEGKHGEILKIKGNPKKGAASARVVLAESSERLPNEDSILWQAKTRGGREFDSVLAGKVNFKESAESVAQVGTAVAAGAVTAAGMQAASGDHDAARTSAGVGAVAGLFSLAAAAASSATETAADTRQWNTLPEKVAYGTYRSGSNALPGVEFDGIAEDSLPKSYGGDTVCKILWTRDHIAFATDLWAKIAGKSFSGSFEGSEADFNGDPLNITFSSTGKSLFAWLRHGDSFLGDWRIEDGRVVSEYRHGGGPFSPLFKFYYAGDIQGNTIKGSGTWEREFFMPLTFPMPLPAVSYNFTLNMKEDSEK